jgi:hypothetical protein
MDRRAFGNARNRNGAEGPRATPEAPDYEGAKRRYPESVEGWMLGAQACRGLPCDCVIKQLSILSVATDELHTHRQPV